MRRNRVFQSAITRLLIINTFAILPAFSQAQTRMIEWPKTSPYSSKARAAPDAHVKNRIDEIEIEGIVVEGLQIQVGEPFSASDDWLKNIGFRVRNISDKQVATIQIRPARPENESGAQPSSLLTKRPEKKEKRHPPGKKTNEPRPGGELLGKKEDNPEKGALRIRRGEFVGCFFFVRGGGGGGGGQNPEPKKVFRGPYP